MSPSLTAILNTAAALGSRALLSPHAHRATDDGVRGEAADDITGRVLFIVGAPLLLKGVLAARTGKDRRAKLDRRETVLEIPLGAVQTALWACCTRDCLFRWVGCLLT